VSKLSTNATPHTGKADKKPEPISKYEVKLSHGDFRRFFYKATVNSMPKAERLDRTGLKRFFSAIRA